MKTVIRVQEIERGADHRITKVITHEVTLEPEPPDEPIYLTPEEMGDAGVRALADDMDRPFTEADLDDPREYPGPAEED